MENLRGGCSCGSVRFELADDPLWVLACHCDACKKRTGSAYGVAVMVGNQTVKEFSGKTRTFTRIGDSGNKIHYDFCPDCGTTLRWHVDIVPGRQAFAGGTFDDMNLLSDCVASQAGCHGFASLAMALRMVRSLRMQATMATIFGLPAVMR